MSCPGQQWLGLRLSPPLLCRGHTNPSATSSKVPTDTSVCSVWLERAGALGLGGILLQDQSWGGPAPCSTDNWPFSSQTNQGKPLLLCPGALLGSHDLEVLSPLCQNPPTSCTQGQEVRVGETRPGGVGPRAPEDGRALGCSSRDGQFHVSTWQAHSAQMFGETPV